MEPVGTNPVTVPSGNLNYEQEIFQPPFEVVTPTEVTIRFQSTAYYFDYALGVVETHQAIATIRFDSGVETYKCLATVKFQGFAVEVQPSEEAYTILRFIPQARAIEEFAERSRIRFTFSSPSQIWIKESILVEQLRVVIVSPFSNGSFVTVGDDSNRSRFLSISPTSTGTIERNPGHLYLTPTWVKLFISGNPSNGTGYLYLREG